MILRMARPPRRLSTAAFLFSLALLSAGCSTAPSDASGPGSTEVAVGGQQFSTADEKTAAFGSPAAAGEFPRVLTHAMGETTIGAKPARIVVLDTGELDAVLALGATPVGMVTTDGAQPLPSYLEDRVSGVETVGSIAAPDLEAIAGLEPDLILGSQLRAEKLYDQLEAIAPTVFSIRPGFPWKENFLLIGSALGMEDEATSTLNEYAKKAKALDESVEGDPTVSLVRWMPGTIRLYAHMSLIGTILTDAGLSRPANQDIDDLATEISPENLDHAAGDYVFYTSYGSPDATGEAVGLATAQWRGLDAVAHGRAHRVDDDVWYLGLGPIGAMRILTDLESYLA